MKVKSSICVLVECFVFENDTFSFVVRQPNGQPLASFDNEDDLGSYLTDLRSNVIANSTLNSQSAKE